MRFVNGLANYIENMTLTFMICCENVVRIAHLKKKEKRKENSNTQKIS